MLEEKDLIEEIRNWTPIKMFSYKLQFINSEYIINWKALLIILFVIILDLSDNFYMIYSAEALHYVANLRGSWRPKVPSLLMQASMNIGIC